MKQFAATLIILVCAVLAMAENKSIHIDGSSTVYPLTEAIAEEFGKKHSDVRVMVGVSGTGGGFKKFTAGEVDIVNASRTIKTEEVEMAKKGKVSYLDVPVAMDGITVVINTKNTWVDHLTVAELKKIWSPDSTVKTWKEVRGSWPDKPIKLYGPGTDSGTFDYFTEAINGKARASRSDYTKSEDDNILVQGVEGDEGALGYFGYSYFVANQKRLKAVPIKDKKVVSPTDKTILDASYSPLSRPLYIYVNKEAMKRTEVREFMLFYLAQAPALAKDTGFVPLKNSKYQQATKELRKVMP
jgi:phosphate transport system substrate-binding protein